MFNMTVLISFIREVYFMNNMAVLQFKMKELKLTKRILVLSGRDVRDIDKKIGSIKEEILRYSHHNKNRLIK